MKFNEDSRVKIPSILHLVGLGYSYLSLKGVLRDEEFNIFTDILKKNIKNLNVDIHDSNTVELFNKVISTTFEKQNLLEKQNQTLKAQRDFLLPMLMNGQVSVK